MSAAGVAVIGTLDTKSEEFAFLSSQLQASGLRVILVDTGVLGTPSLEPHIAAAEVARRGGVSLDELRSGRDRARALKTMAAGAAIVVRELYDRGEIRGAICLGGGQGSNIGAAALHALPIGVPKVIVSTIAAVEGASAMIIGVRDTTLMNSVVDISGLNSLSRVIIANAAAALSGMVLRPALQASEQSKLRVGMTMFGVTSACVSVARSVLERSGFEVLIFAATGPGDRAMEELVQDGLLEGVVDVTISQLGQAVVRGNHPGGVRRLEVAGARGIPQVVTFGGLDIMNCNAGDPLVTEARQGLRKYHQHSPVLTVVRPTPQESGRIGAEIARRLNLAKGPASVLVPTRGFSEYSVPGGPLFDPEADRALITSFSNAIGPAIQVRELDTHINDPFFAEELARTFVGIASLAGAERGVPLARA